MTSMRACICMLKMSHMCMVCTCMHVLLTIRAVAQDVTYVYGMYPHAYNCYSNWLALQVRRAFLDAGFSLTVLVQQVCCFVSLMPVVHAMSCDNAHVRPCVALVFSAPQCAVLVSHPPGRPASRSLCLLILSPATSSAHRQRLCRALSLFRRALTACEAGAGAAAVAEDARRHLPRPLPLPVAAGGARKSRVGARCVCAEWPGRRLCTRC